MSVALAAAMLFAPPLDRPLHYQVVEHVPQADGTLRATTLDETVAFAAETGGYAMTIRSTGYSTELPPAERAAVDAMLRPLVGLAIRIHVSTGGVPERVVGGAAAWDALLASLRTQVAQHAPGDPAGDPPRRLLALLSATPPAARDARFLDAADDVLGAHLPPLAIGAQATTGAATTGDATAGAGAAGAGTAGDGTIVREADADGDWRYRETVRHPGPPPLVSTADYAIAPGTGLVDRIVRRTVIAGATPRLISESDTNRLAD